MAAATQSRNTLFRNVRGVKNQLLKANAKVFKGCLVAVDATGYGVTGATATGLTVVGIATADVDNTGGASGALSVDCLNCEAYLNNDGGDLVDQTKDALQIFMTDDNTVCKTNGGATKSASGTMTGFDSGGVWVRVGVL